MNPDIPVTREDQKERLDELQAAVRADSDRQDIELRKSWSEHLQTILIWIVLLNWLLVFGIGRGWFDYSNYKPFLYSVVGENIAQIIALCVVVVNYLFPKTDN